MKTISNAPRSYFFGSVVTNQGLKLFSFGMILLNRLAAAVPNPYYFNHHGNNYRLSTTAPTDSGDDAIAKDFLNDAGDQIASGDACGNVTEVINPPAQWNTSWVLELIKCDRALSLARDSEQEPHVDFEDCTYNNSQPLQATFERKCNELENGSDIGKVILTIFVVLAALVIIGVGVQIGKRLWKSRYNNQLLDADTTQEELSSIHPSK